MERAKLIVKNFGPLKDIKIEVREMVTFIGAQASGKSTLAKLLSIFEDENFRRDDTITFEEELKKYNMLSLLKENSIINYKKGKYSFYLEKNSCTKVNPREILKNQFVKKIKTSNSNEERNKSFRDLIINDLELNRNHKTLIIHEIIDRLNIFTNNELNFESNGKIPISKYLNYYENLLIEYGVNVKFDSLYIPSERNFLHIIAENTLGLINNNVQIPKHLLNSGQEYEKAIHTIKELPLSIIDKKIKYKREGKSSYIYHNETEKVDLLESASGLQSVVPILLLVEYSKLLKEKYNFNFVVEEPELNLYPKAQHELIKYLVKNCLFDRKNLILTTHSPFVLASINNLLLAFEKGKSKPHEVNKIIKKESWLDPKNFIAYELKNGKAKLIMDDKLGQIKENMIDTVSDAFSDEFDKLLDL
ncbi:AAA family ATPase [Flavobacterium sp. ZT3R18]|uniref:AAA family ATPase n=1 Tax=Flavobacterium sp. ZT3R18 TaxID=2594429 RepID=UPI00117A4A61|nr:AAA family ATPase [Flavobacterium sp. ZT3R18]TRX38937.1 AAA family ATPase [Flavobacterium sp. ZT3R18]